ncbi:MAG: phage tail length tape measure family protein [Pseudomonadota bacterium]
MDIATLGIAVDSSDALTGAQNLDRLGNQAAKTERQTDRMSQGVDRGLNRAGRSVKRFGEQAQTSSFATANLAAQGNDVIVMALAMQNPMQLALQQGTQVSQVLNQMGGRRDIIQSLGAAFTSMVNPVSLVTIGVIAGGAALVQWGSAALGASRSAEDLEKSIEETAESVQSYIDLLKSQNDTFDLGFSRIEEGLKATSQAYKDLIAVAKVDAITAISDATQSLTENVTGFRFFSGESLFQGALPNVGDLLGIDTALQGSITNFKEARSVARDFLGLLEEFSNADSLAAQLEQARALRDSFVAIVGPASEMNAEQVEFLRNLSLVTQQLEAMVSISDEAAVSQAAAAREIEAGYQAVARAQTTITDESAAATAEMIETFRAAADLKDELGEAAFEALRLAGVDMASPISSAAAEAAVLAGNLGIALNEAISLQNLRASQEYSGRGSDPRDFGDPFARTDSGASPISTDAQSLIDRATRRSRGGSSGRTEEERAYNEMLRERDRILESLKTAQDRYNEQVKIAQQLLDAKELTQEQYNEHLRQMQIELQAVEFDSLQRGFESISDTIAGAIVNGDDLGEAFQRVLRQIASDILSSNINQLLQRLFDVGSSGSSGGGILGRIISTIFNAKGNVISNGSVMAFAQGGVVNGPTMFPMSSGVGVMGEAGPEAIMPLKRGPNGDLGVQTSGAGVSVDFVVINNAQGVDVKQREETGPDGRRVLVAEVNSMVVQGEMTQSLQGEFGLRKAKVRR